jgi:hypothetical protein
MTQRSTSRLLARTGASTLLLTFLILCPTSTGLAQNTNAGEIRGTVTDSTGAVVPDVRVIILNTDTGIRKELATNSAGIYDAISILPGSYSIEFRKEGFTTVIRRGITLNVGVITVDASLSVGSVTETLQVNAQVSMLQTESGEQASTLQMTELLQLPNLGADWTFVTKTLPGVVGSGTSLSVNGSGRYQANWLADGGTVTYPNSNNVDIAVYESLAEVKISAATFDAQYGSGSAVMNQISRSGTNQFHGSAYDYAQNDYLNARSFFQAKVGNLRRHNYGGAIGGPVMKNKMFFYFVHDRIINNSARERYSTFPTQAMRTGDFSDPAFPKIYDPATLAQVNGQWVRQPFPDNKMPFNSLDPTAAATQKYFPTPNLGPTDYTPSGVLKGIQQNHYSVLVSKSPVVKYFGKLDYNISNTNRLSGSITWRDSLSFSPAATCPMDCYTGDVEAWQSQVTDVWTISPNVVNEVRLAFLRQANWFVSPNYGQGYPAKLGINYAIADTFPNVSISGPVASTSIGSGLHSILIENTFSPSDTVTIVRGRHIIKAGGQLTVHQHNYSAWPDTNAASFTFSGIVTKRAPYDSPSGLGYADFLTGLASGYSASLIPLTGARSKPVQMFLQDDFKLLPNLTINLGVRYEIQPGWRVNNGMQALFDPTIINSVTNTPGAMWWQGANGRDTVQQSRRNIFLPRVGFAWSPWTKWSVRGGFGMYTYAWSTDNYLNQGRGMGFAIAGSMSTTDGMTPVLRISDTNPNLNLYYPSASNRQPESMNGQSVPYYPYKTPVAHISNWSFGIGRELSYGLVAEVAYVGSHGGDLSFPRDVNQVPENLLGPGDAQSRRPYSQYQSINADLYDALSNYHSLQVMLRKQLSSGISFDANYTWAKNLVSQDASGWNGQSGTQGWQRAYAPLANYGLSNDDIPHQFKTSVVYQWPFGKGRMSFGDKGPLNALFGGWQSSAIIIVRSGTPFNPIVGTSNLSGSLAGSWYPNRIGDGALSDPTNRHWFDTSAFVAPAAYTFGNSGRNVLRGPGFSSVDFSMSKEFSIPKLEQGRLQVRMDAANAINHPSFSNPNASIGTANAGVISGTSLSGRTLQLSARMSF